MSSLLLDVNVLVAAHRGDHPAHLRALALVDGEAGEGFAWCAHVANGFLRLVTRPGVFSNPTPPELALAALDRWRARPRCLVLPDTPAVWACFQDLCRRERTTGNAVYDLHLAALALVHRCTLVSSDRGFARIPALTWREP